MMVLCRWSFFIGYIGSQIGMGTASMWLSWQAHTRGSMSVHVARGGFIVPPLLASNWVDNSFALMYIFTAVGVARVMIAFVRYGGRGVAFIINIISEFTSLVMVTYVVALMVAQSGLGILVILRI